MQAVMLAVTQTGLRKGKYQNQNVLIAAKLPSWLTSMIFNTQNTLKVPPLFDVEIDREEDTRL